MNALAALAICISYHGKDATPGQLDRCSTKIENCITSSLSGFKINSIKSRAGLINCLSTYKAEDRYKQSDEYKINMICPHPNYPICKTEKAKKMVKERDK